MKWFKDSEHGVELPTVPRESARPVSRALKEATHERRVRDAECPIILVMRQLKFNLIIAVRLLNKDLRNSTNAPSTVYSNILKTKFCWVPVFSAPSCIWIFDFLQIWDPMRNAPSSFCAVGRNTDWCLHMLQTNWATFRGCGEASPDTNNHDQTCRDTLAVCQYQHRTII